MNTEYYDRYKLFRENGTSNFLPNIKIAVESGDLFVKYDKNKMRMDNLSYKYYGDPNYGWLILSANPKYGSMEFEIEDGAEIRIPYPLQSALNRYETCVNKMLK